MQLHQLHAFLTVAQDLNFRRAAARLFLSQPALSAHIRDLERHLGIRLFDRDRSGTRLTADGAELLPLVRSAVAAVAEVELAARTSSRDRRRFCVGILAVGVGELTWPLIRTFSDARPDLRLEVMHVGFGEVLPQLTSGAVDALLAIGPFGEEDGATVTVGSVPLAAILPANHPQVHDPAVDVSWLGERMGFRTAVGAGETFARFWTLQDVSERPLNRLPILDAGVGVHEFQKLVASGVIGAWPGVVPALPPAVLRPVTGGRTAPLQIVTPHNHHPDVKQFCQIAQRLAAAAA